MLILIEIIIFVLQPPEKLWNEIMTGHDTSPETIENIKAARATQDEAHRLSMWDKNRGNAGILSHKAHVLGGKAGSREAKQRAARISVQNGSYAKAIHTRWHVNRGRTNPFCAFCHHSAD